MGNDEHISISLAEIALHCDGELKGDPTHRVSGISAIDQPSIDKLSFLVNAKHLAASQVGDDTSSQGSGAHLAIQPGVVLLRREDQHLFSGNCIVVSDPYLAYARVSGLFVRSDTNTGVHPSAVIDPTAILADGVSVGAGSVVGAHSRIGARVRIAHQVVVEDYCEIDDDGVIESHVTVCTNTRIGKRCWLSPGVRLGGSGFGYAPNGDSWEKIHQLGRVVLGDDVDVGCNTTIDRGAIGDTVIGQRVKLDNQIQIAHNVQVGDDTIMAGCVAIAGSAVIGNRCKIGGRASILGHLLVADDVTLNANAFVAGSIKTAGTYSSMIPAQPVERWRKTVARLNRLGKQTSASDK